MFYTTSTQSAKNIETMETTNTTSPDTVKQWLNLGPDFANAANSILSIFKQDQISEYEREIAVQSKIYSLQYQQQQQQQKTIIIAAVVCVLAVIFTVFLTKK